MTQSPAALRGAAAGVRDALLGETSLAGRLDDAAATIEAKDAEIERLRAALADSIGALEDYGTDRYGDLWPRAIDIIVRGRALLPGGNEQRAESK